MDAAKNDSNHEAGKKNNEGPLSYNSQNMSSDWQISGTSFANSSMGLIPPSNHPVAACQEDMIVSTSCSSGSMVGSICPTIWEQASGSQNFGFSDVNVQQGSTPHSIGARTIGLGPFGPGLDRTLGIGWNPPNAVFKGGGMFLPTVPGMLPQSLAQIPADSNFIERAARFSSFSGGNFGDMMNPFMLQEPVNPYFRGAGMIRRPQEVSAGSELQSMTSVQFQKNEINTTANLTDVSLLADLGATEGSRLTNDRKSENVARSQDEGTERESDDAEFSGHGGQEELEGAGGESSAKGSSKKRKRTDQDVHVDEHKEAPEPVTEATENLTASQQKEDQNTTSTTTKLGGKNAKQGPQASDPSKDEYIHVRARRGQATNSHSLAERVRREKISERMKFLQDLVPGCSKVTGKAVMLDEIINYVQSLQRQVEFLSMKLATVNPRLNFNIESLLAKDMLQSRAGPSSSLAFPPDFTMQYPGLHLPPPGVMQVGLPGLDGSSDALRRSLSSQFTNMVGGYKESSSQLHLYVPNSWDDELHNIVHMGINSISPVSSQDPTASLPPGHMKAEQ